MAKKRMPSTAADGIHSTKLEREIDEVVADDTENELTAEDIAKLRAAQDRVRNNALTAKERREIRSMIQIVCRKTAEK